MSDETSLDDRAIAFLREHTTPATAEQVAEALELRPASVQRLLGRLVRIGRARRAGGKRYTALRRSRS